MSIPPQTSPAIPRCPPCRAKAVIKKGLRTTRHEARQRWGCTRCGHTFTNLVTKHSAYPVKVIMETMCRYNLGYSARDTVRYLKGRFRIAVPEKTFRLWYTCAPQLLHLYAVSGSACSQRARSWVRNSTGRETSERG
jgi:hypothetical protein